jgi:hypothetical protein
MARRNIRNSSARIERLIKQGRGSGQGANYQPWLRTQDVSSLGFTNRVPGWKTAREHHLLSNLERDVFYVLEWEPSILDIREQYPLLPLDLTLSIAEKLGIAHPKEPGTRQPVVMTTDFLISQSRMPSPVDTAICVKPSAELESERVQQKLAIEQVYWKSRAIGWVVWTERDIPEALAFNVRWLHDYLDVSGIPDATEMVKGQVAQLVSALLAEGMTLAKAACVADDRLGLLAGTSLSLVRYFIATRRWIVDMEQRINPQQPLILQSTAEEDTTHGALRQYSA